LSKPLELEHLYSVLSQHLSVCDDKDNHEPQETQLLIPDPKLRRLFYMELAKQHTEITKSIDKLDYDSLMKAVHIIKGSAGSFGHDDLTPLAAHSLLLLKQQQYVQGLQQCTKLNQKVAEVLNEHND
jgi:HPt (histidine-containing phosphotransfer) domain-containing protein